MRYGLSLMLRRGFLSNGGAQKRQKLGFYACFFADFPTLMKMESAVDVVALVSSVMSLQSRPYLCGTIALLRISVAI